MKLYLAPERKLPGLQSFRHCEGGTTEAISMKSVEAYVLPLKLAGNEGTIVRHPLFSCETVSDFLQGHRSDH